MRDFINAGHKIGVDSGAINKSLGVTEAEITLKISEQVQKYLKAIGHNVYVLQSDNLCGETPTDVNITETANDWGADLFVSIHCNAFNGTVRGVETCAYSEYSKGYKLAECIQSQLVDSLHKIDNNIPDRGIKIRKDLAVLRYTNMPAVLVEVAFIDNEKDVKLLMNNQDDIARAIARGITDYLLK